jgi:NitT/TauT family transport system permease protein
VRLTIRHASTQVLYVALGLALAVLTWEVLYRGWSPGDYLFPSPQAVATALRENASELLDGARVTVYETLLGFFAAVIGGAALAVFLHRLPRVGQLVWPVILVLQVTPQIAIAPLLVIWFGVGIVPKVVLGFLVAFFPIVVNTYFGLGSMPSEVRELARSMHARGGAYFLRFELPAALPHFMTGARIGITYAVIGTVIAEFMASNEGLGNMLLTANGSLNAALATACVVVLTACGVLLYLLVGAVERLVAPWSVAARRRGA